MKYFSPENKSVLTFLTWRCTWTWSPRHSVYLSLLIWYWQWWVLRTFLPSQLESSNLCDILDVWLLILILVLYLYRLVEDNIYWRDQHVIYNYIFMRFSLYLSIKYIYIYPVSGSLFPSRTPSWQSHPNQEERKGWWKFSQLSPGEGSRQAGRQAV